VALPNLGDNAHMRYVMYGDIFSSILLS